MKKRLLYLFIITLSLNSCMSIYQPNVATPTQFKEKNDLLVSGSFDAEHIYGKIAFSPIKHIYIHGNTIISLAKPPSHYYQSFSGGIGFYVPIDEKMQFESSIEYGKGKFDYGDPFSGSDYSLTGADGTLSFFSFLLSFNYLHNSKFSQGIVLETSVPSVTYNKANFNWLNGNTYSKFDFGFHYFLKYKPKIKYLQLFLGFGVRPTSMGTEYTIRSPSIVFRTGLEFKLK